MREFFCDIVNIILLLCHLNRLSISKNINKQFGYLYLRKNLMAKVNIILSFKKEILTDEEKTQKTKILLPHEEKEKILERKRGKVIIFKYIDEKIM